MVDEEGSSVGSAADLPAWGHQTELLLGLGDGGVLVVGGVLRGGLWRQQRGMA